MVRPWILAALALALLGAAKADPPKKAAISNQAAEQRQQPPAPPTPAASDPRERYRPHPNYNQNDCYKNTDHDAADLCAQWRAAIAAEKAAEWSRRGVFVAVGGALLSFASIILVLMALRQGRDANRISMKEAGRNTRRTLAAAVDTETALAIAARNADSAADQVEVARQTRMAQLRPWVFVDNVKIEFENMQTANAVIFFRNFGNWPATNFSKTVHARQVPYPFAAMPLEEPDQSLATVLPPSGIEEMVAEGLPRPKAGYATRVDMVWSYDLPDGAKESAHETFVVDVNRGQAGARKMTAYDSANHPSHAKKDE